MKHDIQLLCDILKAGNIGNFRQEARWIAEESASPQSAIELARRRSAGEPLQYLLGTAPFRDLMLKVDRRVLIPRPETELLAGWLIENAPANGHVLDLGCGSGAIGIAVASERPDLQVTSVDISADALDLAGENARLCGTDNIRFIQSDLFSALEDQKFDFIGANLPYVTEEEYLTLDKEVRDFEPELALTAPDNGLKLILQSIALLPRHLNRGGGAIYELSPEQAPAAAAAMHRAGLTAGIIRDLCDRDRFVSGMFK